MNKKRWILVVIIVVVIVAGLLTLSHVFQNSESTVEDQKADIAINASELLASFESNEQEANTKYLDKVITVSGRIDSLVEDDVYITVTLKNGNGQSGILCSFDKNTVSKEDFPIGETIRVKGICTGYLLDVVLTKCSLV